MIVSQLLWMMDCLKEQGKKKSINPKKQNQELYT